MGVTCFLFVVILFLNASESGICKLICERDHDSVYFESHSQWDDSSNLCSFYYMKFEHALRNNRTTLWRLQQMFVQDNPVYVLLLVTVTICNDTYERFWTWQWNPYKSLSNIISISFLSQFDITPISGLIVFVLQPDNFQYFRLMLHLDELPCSSNQSDIEAALPPFLSWIKAYAKWHGEPDSWDSNDKGLISNFYSDYDWQSPSHDRELNQLFMASYVCELVFVFMLILKFAPGYYQVLSEKMHHNATMYSIYWGSVFIIFLYNLSFIITNFGYNTAFKDVKYYYLEIPLIDRLTFAVMVSVPLLSLAVVVWMAYKTSRQNGPGVRMPIPTKVVNVLFCCCFCFCCSRKTKSIAVQIIALWNILIFVFAFITSTIPLFFLIILHPSKTLSILSLIFSTFFFFVILAAHLFHLGRSSVWKLCTNIFATLLFSGIVAIFIVVYIVCLDKGVQTKGISGFLVSLLPSAFLSVIGWYIKRKFLKPADINDAETGSPIVEYENPDTQINSNVYPSTQTLASSPTEHTPLIQQEN